MRRGRHNGQVVAEAVTGSQQYALRNRVAGHVYKLGHTLRAVGGRMVDHLVRGIVLPQILLDIHGTNLLAPHAASHTPIVAGKCAIVFGMAE